MRDSSVIGEELALVEGVKGQGNKIGKLRKELVEALKAEAEALSGDLAEARNAISDDPVRADVAKALLCAHYEKHGQNVQHIGGLVATFEQFYDAFDAMLKGGGREALITRCKKAESEAKDIRSRMRLAEDRARDLGEKLKVAEGRLVMNNLPV